ncbi:MAG: hypothetical protein QOJ73_539 [Streptosporangiaceae bacterium]|jgi:hypothetical protein|nr:hypothetical protein [Streptosporangiaceae bacterium]
MPTATDYGAWAASASPGQTHPLYSTKTAPYSPPGRRVERPDSSVRWLVRKYGAQNTALIPGHDNAVACARMKSTKHRTKSAGQPARRESVISSTASSGATLTASRSRHAMMARILRTVDSGAEAAASRRSSDS